VLFFCLMIVVAAGCVSIKTSTVRRSRGGAGNLVMIYGAGSSRPIEGSNEAAEYWMTVHVTLSDSTYQFGHVDGRGDFKLYCDAWEPTFRIRGGETRHFALRGGDTKVYPVADSGSFEFSGPSMSASRAVFPPMDESYFSITTFTFEISRDSVVTAEMIASSPNGFARTR
jgi:hypothetical protein